MSSIFSICQSLLQRNLLAVAILTGVGTAGTASDAYAGSADAASVVFSGTSPCGELIRPLLGIPGSSESDIIEWKLTLYQEPKTLAPSRYQLHCQYGSTAAGKPGLAKDIKTLEREGAWTIGKGIKSNPDTVVYELQGGLSLALIDANILHVLNPDRSLMIGNGGWSFTLNREDHAEKRVDPTLALSQPSMSYRISPLATGPTVLGVFEGRSPCHGIARELKIRADRATTKVKWRVTLYQNPETHAPTTYKIEGSLYRRGMREGEWSIVPGNDKNSNATIYRLAPTKTQRALFLLKGDDNVLFFLDQNLKPLVGHRDFSYTLNRRRDDPSSK